MQTAIYCFLKKHLSGFNIDSDASEKCAAYGTTAIESAMMHDSFVAMKNVVFTATIAVSLSTAQAADAPQVKALVPGLAIKALPITLTNVDSVDYGPDGRLYAAGYDGRVHVLTDTDGDGLEDKVEVFWSKPGDLLTPVGILATKEGVYVAARGKVALLRDTDGDGIADTSEAVVSGWHSETHNSDTRNDAAGVAVDADGNLYFSLGCMSYNKAWLLDSKGQSQYDMRSERGTILKVSADRQRREIVATGLRFVIGMDFNKHGDLFATDQEGDTWFPGGNPRDELLQIIPGRHYGFPFRHPKYLPSVIDEPAVVDFSPQHQSTCGFRFNELRSHRQPFGPAYWEGDAIVTGFSRGKLWRVPLAKSRAGYIGKQIQFAALESLPTDVAISPSGDLLVTCHGGKPDWGSGPAANGYLYKISFDATQPQPVTVWSASPLEVKVAFDRPVDPKQLQAAQIEMGDFVWEGDQHEWIFPGYDVVKQEKGSLRRSLKVGGLAVSDDGRTVTLTTAGQPWRTRYAMLLPGVASAAGNGGKGPSDVEMSFDLSGVQAEWTREGDSRPAWTGWLPHVDTNVIDALTAGSAEHDRLKLLLHQPGSLLLRSQLLLPGNHVAFRFEASHAFAIKCGDVVVNSIASRARHVAEFTMDSKQPQHQSDPRGGREQILPSDEVPLEIVAQTGATGNAFLLDASYHADFDPYERPLRLEHLFVPWAPTIQPPDEETLNDEDALVVGDPVKGRELFFGNEASCANCHTFAGNGGKVAADLTVSVRRSPEAVMRDIVEPNVAINPEYVSYTLLTDSGEVLTGLLQTADQQQITLVDANGKLHQINRAEVEDIRASSVSLMPTSFDKLGKEKLQDLVAFLCSEDEEAKRNGLPTGVIAREFWLGLPKQGLSSLAKHKDFPNQPTGTGLLTRFESPVNWGDSFGTRIRGYIYPPQTGDYVFCMAADDYAELWMSSSEDPAKKFQIIQMKRWTPSRVWDKYPEQKSKPIRLQAGKRYYIEALHVEATVDDCLAVGWQLPDGTMERPIPGTRLSTADNLEPAQKDTP
ncbi:PA14 domain protein [Aureliella helgolandensis]|uniref:PA14 domain protein n=2 Tax=Aureliella helgolandensis TaxID=2527968 RepID=A0A518G7U4_9BACT|nr:PA14 domain protein [Aureliella helgolandensis]